MKQIKCVVIAIVSVSSLLLSSCATSFMADTPDELKTMREARLTYGIGGALVGAGAAYALSGGKSSKEKNRNAILGGLAGGLIGDAIGQGEGTRTIKDKREAKATEAQLKADIDKSEKFNSALSSYNSRLSREINELRKSKDSKKLRTSKSQSKTALRQANSQLSATEKYIADPANSNGKSRMQSKERALKRHIAKLEQNQRELEKIATTPKI